MRTTAALAALAMIVLVAGIFAIRAFDDNGARAQPVAQAGDAHRTPEARRARHEIQNDPVAPTVAPQGYDVTIVFFTDYQCPYCRQMHPVLETLLDEDPKVKLVYRDWPIFGAASTEAAIAAIAAQYQGKHPAFNAALMESEGRLSADKIRDAADKVGVDWARLQADQTEHRSAIGQALGRTSRHAAAMGLSGTPALLVGPYLIPGAVSIDTLREAVAMARAEGEGSEG